MLQYYENTNSNLKVVGPKTDWLTVYLSSVKAPMMIFINILIPINLCLFQLNLDGLRRWEGTFLEDNHYEEEEEAVELDEVVEDENVSEEYVSNLREAATDVIHSLEMPNGLQSSTMENGILEKFKRFTL